MKVNKIKGFGDSFIYGSELKDCPPDSKHIPSKLTWPALIAKELNLLYTCHAIPGIGNNYIAQQVMKYATPDCLCIINWTWIDRWDFYNITTSEWDSVRPTGTEDNPLSDNYYRNFQSQLMDQWQSLNVINSTHLYLEKHGINYVSHIMDELLLECTHNPPTYVARLQNDIRDTILRFPYYTTFLTWSQMNDFEISEQLHPLEEAHEAAAKLWLKEYDLLQEK